MEFKMTVSKREPVRPKRNYGRFQKVYAKAEKLQGKNYLVVRFARRRDAASLRASIASRARGKGGLAATLRGNTVYVWRTSSAA